MKAPVPLGVPGLVALQPFEVGAYGACAVNTAAKDTVATSLTNFLR